MRRRLIVQWSTDQRFPDIEVIAQGDTADGDLVELVVELGAPRDWLVLLARDRYDALALRLDV